MKSHTDYDIVNREWILYDDVNHTLSSYLHLKLDVRNADNKLDRYLGICPFYIRNEYGYEYKSCKSNNGILIDRHRLDPWDRKFVAFPNFERVNDYRYGFEGYYAYNVYKTVYNNEVKGDFSIFSNNVIVLRTTVNGGSVYCVDILAGMYVK